MKSKASVSLINSGNKWPFILVTSLFFLWGLANNMTDTLLAAFKRIMSMTDFQTSWIQLAFYGSYFLLALPAAILIKKYTYKNSAFFLTACHRAKDFGTTLSQRLTFVDFHCKNRLFS